MTSYAAFLRGVNVGGQTIIKMAELKTCLEKAGLKDVRTFIASGNVIFNSDIKDQAKLTKQIEQAIEKTFKHQVAVLLFDFDRLEKLVESIPPRWVNDKEMKCDVMLVWPDIDSPQTIDKLPHNPDIEDVMYVPGAIIWRIDRDKVSKSRMLKIVGTKLHKQITVRNPNTMRKIYALMLS